MKYPMISNCLTFKRINCDEYDVQDFLLGYDYIIDSDIVAFARKLDGKHDPYLINKDYSHEEVDQIMAALEENNLIRHKKTFSKGFGTIYRTLWIPKYTRIVRTVAVIWNIMLNLLWLPIFVFGVLRYSKALPMGGYEYMVFGIFFGVFVSLFLHELGHMCAGIHHGAMIFEMGVMLYLFIPGAYVMMDLTNVKPLMNRVNIHSAGVKSDILFSGIYLLVACLVPDKGVPFLAAAIVTILSALINIVFVNGFDGEAIISNILGIEDIVSKAKEIFHNKKTRQKILAQKGANKYALLAVMTVICVIQIALPIIYIISVLEIISCFL